MTRGNHLVQIGKRYRCPVGTALVCFCLGVAGLLTHAQQKPKPQPDDSHLASGKATFMQYCASCHGRTGTGDGPAAFAMKPPPPNLTTLAKLFEGRFPAGYIGALLKFGHNLAAHGSDEMPVWGVRFRALDPQHDPTGQQHIDDVVAYIMSLQVN